jgi:hypothetical protein
MVERKEGKNMKENFKVTAIQLAWEKAWLKNITEDYRKRLGSIENFKSNHRLLQLEDIDDIIKYQISHDAGAWLGSIKKSDVFEKLNGLSL